MKRFIFTSMVALVIVLFFNPISVYAEELVWYKYDMPPVYILSGPYQNQGFIDVLFNKFREEMKGYSHVVLVANIKRLTYDVATSNVIGESLLKTAERQKILEFSVPHTLGFPQFIMIPKIQAEKLKPWLTADGSVMLEKLITESDLKMIVSLGRSYTGFIDEILKKYPDHRNIITRRAKEKILQGILRMILTSRADYTIAYGVEVYYLAKTMAATENFVSFPIEGMPKYILGYTAVPKNKWGKKILNELNPLILKHRNTLQTRKVKETWMDENMKALSRRYMDEVFGPADR